MYRAYLPGIPNCIGRGETKEEAHANLFDKLAATLQVTYELEKEVQEGANIFETLKNQHDFTAVKQMEINKTLSAIEKAREVLNKK